MCACMGVPVCSTLRIYEKQHVGMLGLTLPTPCLGHCSPGSFPSPLMKCSFMSYSHPVLTTTIVSLPGPHVSHHQWDPNVADKIISLSLCCNHIPPTFSNSSLSPITRGSHTQATIPPCFFTSPSLSHPTSPCFPYRLVLIFLLVLKSQLFGACPVFLARPPSTICPISKCLLRVADTILGTGMQQEQNRGQQSTKQNTVVCPNC